MSKFHLRALTYLHTINLYIYNLHREQLHEMVKKKKQMRDG